MEINSPEAEPRRKTIVRRIFAFVVVTAVAAAFGAGVGWMLGSVLAGALFGAIVGFYGCFRSGYAMGEPNVERPGF